MSRTILIICILYIQFITINGIASNYYIDSNSGNDFNSGLSPEKAWSSLSKVNNTSFNPGDSILFKSGEIWNGQLLIDDKGTENKPIVYTFYGEGGKPQINGQGQEVYTIKLADASHTEFSGFDITNTGTTSQAGRLGVYITTMNGDIQGLVVKDCDIHDVNGEVDKNLQSKTTGAGFGIYWSNKGSANGRLVDALIQGNHIYRCERNGMGGAINRNVYHLRLLVRQNLIEQVPGDAIIMNTCENSIAEYNVARDFPRTLPESNAAAGIWPFNSKNTIIQFNEVSGHQAYLDGQGFDSDFWCENTTIQYNYSHDNAGGFLLICGSKDRSPDGESSPNTGTIVRYNISINDGGRTWGKHAHDFPLIYFHGHPEGTMIYNNTFYYGNKMSELNGTSPHMIKEIWGEPWSTSIYNNIFASQLPGAKIDMRKNKNTSIDNNLYYNTPTVEDENGPITDINAVKANPMFVDMLGYTVDDYQLTEGSPAIKAGRVIPDNGGRDFFGNPVSDTEVPNIGADNTNEWVGILDTPAQDELFTSYPNITRDSFYIDIKEPLRNAEIRLCSLNGELLNSYSYKLLSNDKLELNLAKQRSGMYIVHIIAEGKQQSKRIIKL
ncbi:T9SS type A sorting domain-containing protein [Carboxylicivirga marina]|uniref:T9SS type A sorting domain-containing protein n=1 Tax=Carboxylicivirga marina TaxID=2800988 RepID=UPI002596C233|nr:T9SS type A sorting domain-containing protein [uncultured Carboxylicivirga sp.]